MTVRKHSLPRRTSKRRIVRRPGKSVQRSFGSTVADCQGQSIHAGCFDGEGLAVVAVNYRLSPPFK
jgi:hypothetical protein